MPCPALQPTSKPGRPLCSATGIARTPVLQESSGILPAFCRYGSIVEMEHQRHDYRCFDCFITAPGRNEAPVADGLAGGIVEAWEIAAFFDVDRECLAIAGYSYAQHDLALFSQSARERWIGRAWIVQVCGVEARGCECGLRRGYRAGGGRRGKRGGDGGRRLTGLGKCEIARCGLFGSKGDELALWWSRSGGLFLAGWLAFLGRRRCWRRGGHGQGLWRLKQLNAQRWCFHSLDCSLQGIEQHQGMKKQGEDEKMPTTPPFRRLGWGSEGGEVHRKTNSGLKPRISGRRELTPA